MPSGKPKKKNPRLAASRRRSSKDPKIVASKTSMRSKYRTVVKNMERAIQANDNGMATKLFYTAQVLAGKMTGGKRMATPTKKEVRSQAGHYIDPNRPWPNPKKAS